MYFKTHANATVFSLWKVIYPHSPPPPRHASGFNHFLQKTFFPIWKSSDSLKSRLNPYASFCKLFVAICLPHMTVTFLEAERKLSAFACLTTARAAWHVSSWMFVEWRRERPGHCAGAPLGKPQGKIKVVRQRLPLGSLSTREVKINTRIIVRQNPVIALGYQIKLYGT